MNKTLSRTIKSKKGIEIKEGEKVTVAFDVKSKSTGEILSNYISLTTSDNRRVITRDFSCVGFERPSEEELGEMVSDGVVESVFGNNTEPDGWCEDNSPSWLLAMGLI